MSLHIAAKEGDFAKVVLMPGDPRRAEWIAKTFLKDARLVNDVRGMTAYTGYLPDGNLISVMPSGMGMPSIGIYSQELFTSYGVEVIMRIGTMGTYSPDVNLRDVVIAEGCCCDNSGIEAVIPTGGQYSAIGDFSLMCKAVEAAKKNKVGYAVGNILSANVFYDPEPVWQKWAKMGVLGVEMEGYALYSIAAGFRKKALVMCTVTDTFVGEGRLSAEERQAGLVDMVKVALDTASAYYAEQK